MDPVEGTLQGKGWKERGGTERKERKGNGKEERYAEGIGKGNMKGEG